MRVYRGVPDSRLQPRANAANQAQGVAWRAAVPHSDALHLVNRPLRYPPRWPNGQGNPQEKGIDVALAVDLVHLAYLGSFDVAIVCSHDSDLSPALDVASSLAAFPIHVEVASWGRRRRISFTNRPNQPWCHTSIETHSTEFVIRTSIHEAPDQLRNVREESYARSLERQNGWTCRRKWLAKTH